MREHEIVLVVAQYVAQRDLNAARGAEFWVLRDLALGDIPPHLPLIGASCDLALAVQTLQGPRRCARCGDRLPLHLGAIRNRHL